MDKRSYKKQLDNILNSYKLNTDTFTIVNINETTTLPNFETKKEVEKIETFEVVEPQKMDETTAPLEEYKFGS